MKILKLLIVMLLLFLTGCATQSKCVRVGYYDYRNTGCIKHLYQFKGAYYPKSDLVIIDKYLGEGNFTKFEKCEDPASLDGFYNIVFNVGAGSYHFVGEGSGGIVYVRANAFPGDHVEYVIKQFSMGGEGK